MLEHVAYQPAKPLLIIVGNYGSGKTEVAVNLALNLAVRGHAVSIADLDVVNPYFRCREATAEMEERGIRVIVPKGEWRDADLPILLPEVRGAIVQHGGPSEAGAPRSITILDVGGDDVGARILGTLAASIATVPHAMLQVVNERRPFTDTVAGCAKIRGEIEAAARLRVTGLLSNTHLMEETDQPTIVQGYAFAKEVGAAAGLPVEAVSADRRLLETLAPEALGHTPVVAIDRRMLPPWYLRTQRTDKAARVLITNRLRAQ